MEDFAKLFRFEGIGQVLVNLDEGDDGPEVRIYFRPEGLGICSTAFRFKEDENESEWDKAEKAFTLVDEEIAEGIVREMLKDTSKFGGE